MASEGSSSAGVVAIFAIVILAMIGGFIAWQAGVFGGVDGDGGDKKVDIDINPGGGSK